MRFGNRLLNLALLTMLPAMSAVAGEIQVPVAAREGLAVTIYNENLALVKDRRKIDLPAGKSDIAFEEISAQLRPETALLRGDAIRVIEQNFDFDLLTPQKVLEKSVGSTIHIEETNPATGEKKIQEGKLLSVNDGAVVKIGDRIETSIPGRMYFSELPPKLRIKPTLVLSLENQGKSSQSLELSYLTSGLKWNADYVAELNATENQMALNGLVTLTNNSGVEYSNALLQLVAGGVNQVQPEPPMFMEDRMFAKAMAPGVAGGMAHENLADFHLYTLDHPTTVGSGQTKQVSLLSGQGIKAIKEYRLDNPVNVYEGQSEFQKRNVAAWLKFTNTKKNGLGMPLPKGTIRVYKADRQNRLLFVGEDAIKHTAENDEVKLKLGDAFDVSVEGKRTSYTKLSNQIFKTGFEIKLKNAKSDPVNVSLYQSIPGEWEIQQETYAHEQKNANQVFWDIMIPAASEVTLSFVVQVQR